MLLDFQYQKILQRLLINQIPTEIDGSKLLEKSYSLIFRLYLYAY